MSSVQRNAKIYGAVETETFMTFQGFCKKIYDTTQQEIQIFIDDKKIDTLIANEKIPNIEDKYEVFDTVGFCFTYKLPKEYIGEKHKLEFKTNDGEQLVHSPIVTVDSSNEKYNEYLFLESLNEPIDEEKIKDVYCPNSIGFLAKDINLNDRDFIEYIKTLNKKFPELIIKPICFNESEKDLIKLSFEKEIYSKFKILEPAHIQTLIPEINLFCENFTTVKQDTNHDLFIYLMKNSSNIYTYGFRSDLSIKLIEKEIDLYTKVFKELNINYSMDTEINISTFKFFDLVSIAINNNQFRKVIYKFKNGNNS